MKRLLAVFLICFAVLALEAAQPKYIFLFIGDGMSTPQRMMADEFSMKRDGRRLVINQLPFHATTRSCSASSLVTDSAAAATAIACGEKTVNGKLGVGVDNRPLESVAEAAKKHGRKVGIVTSVTINHATPGGFYAHRSNRSQGYAIGLDLLASDFDYFAGGGFGKYADDKKSPEYRGELYELLKSSGYTLTTTRAEFDALRPGAGKVFARGSLDALPYELDADGTVPTLAEFTKKGIELLDNPNGFFMMVEGGSIDWCGHANDPATNLNEVLGLDKAVAVAMEFGQKHPEETLIVVTGDHETGGMTMGFAGTGYNLYMERLASQHCSTDEFVRWMREAYEADPELTFDDVKRILTDAYGFKFEGKGPMVLAEKEQQELERIAMTKSDNKRAVASSLGQAAKRIMSAKAGVGWTSGAHTALPVLTTSWGCGAESFTGFIENTDISKKLKALL